MRRNRLLALVLAVLLAAPTGGALAPDGGDQPEPLEAWSSGLPADGPTRALADRADRVLELSRSPDLRNPSPGLITALGLPAQTPAEPIGPAEHARALPGSPAPAVDHAFRAAAASLGPGLSAPSPAPSGFDAAMAWTQAPNEASARQAPAPPASVQAALEGLPAEARGPVETLLGAQERLDQAVESQLAERPIDPDRLQAARDAELSRVAAALDRLATVDADAELTLCPYLILDLAGVDSRHECAAAVSIDTGGDDVYTNNAAGVRGGAAILVDLAGQDRYEPTTGLDLASSSAPLDGSNTTAVNGAADHGVSVLVDQAGPDVYDASIAEDALANGATRRGAALLADLAGHDAYKARLSSGAANGASLDGHALLYDGGGKDRYDVEAGGQALANGATRVGSARLFDAAGDDDHLVEIGGSGAAIGASGNLSEPALDTLSPSDVQRPPILAAPDANASATLVDQGGSDTYRATLGSGAAHGAAGQGAAMLLDADGNDTYEARLGSGAAIGSGATGVGQLLDRTGSDHYRATTTGAGVLQGAGHLGLGLLHDGGGQDGYQVRMGQPGPTQGAGLLGAGLLHDSEGWNWYVAQGARASQGSAVGFPHDPARFPLQADAGVPVATLPGSLGLLVGSPGFDDYESDGVTQGSGDRGALGVLVDTGGANFFDALGTEIGQGTGRHLGTGLLLDLGEASGLSVGPDVVGQGSGLQGVGALVRPNSLIADGASTLLALRATTADGGGIGIALERQDGTIHENFDLTCPNSERLTPQEELERFVVCSPDPTTKRQLVNPVSGEAAREVPKPACSHDPAVGPEPSCQGALGPLVRDGTAEWLSRDNATTTTSGGLVLTGGVEKPGDDPIEDPAEVTWKGRIVQTSVDDSCGAYCFVITDHGSRLRS